MATPAAVSYVRILHASPDAPPVDIYVNGNMIAQNLPYKQFTGYMTVNPGRYNIQVFPTGQTMNPVVNVNVAVPPGSAYTVAAVGRVADIGLLPIPEKYLPVMPMHAANNANVRFIHLSPNAPAVDIMLPNGTILFQNVAFKTYTDYISVQPGEYTLLVKPNGSNQTVLTVPNVYLMPGETYSIYAVGLAGETPPLEALLTTDGGY
jgi:hypothetical protein